MTPLQCCGAVDRARAILDSDTPCERDDGLDLALAEIVLAMLAPSELAEVTGDDAPAELGAVDVQEVAVAHALWMRLSLPQRYRFFSMMLTDARALRAKAKAAGIIP